MTGSHLLTKHVTWPSASKVLKLVELAGADHTPYAGDSDALLDEIEEFLTGIRHGAEPDRILATVLFTDIVDSTNYCSNTTSLCEGSWRGSVAGR